MNALKTISQFYMVSIFLPLTACGEPEQKFKVKVVDEAHAPMKGVEVAAWFNRRGKNAPLDSYKVTGLTDADGLVELKGETVWYQTSVSAQPEGFYKSMKYDHWTVKRNGNRWEPWPVEVELVMKKVRNPQPMYAVRAHGEMRFRHPDPSMENAYGFDLMAMDWVTPSGKGKHADIMVRMIPDDPDDKGFVEEGGVRVYHVRNGRVSIMFPNTGDGIQAVNDTGGSELLGPAMSPESDYKDHMEFPDAEDSTGKSAASRACHVFRIRTALDKQGKIKTCYYGKIDGDLKGTYSSKPYFRMTYYLNGSPNERSLEWDGKNNLFKNLERQYWPEQH